MDAPARGRLVALGVVTRPHGVRGDVRVRPFHAQSTTLRLAETLWLWPAEQPERARACVPIGCRRAGDGWIVRFEGVHDRDAASTLRGMLVGVPRQALPPLAEDEIYVADLEGVEARDPSGRCIGVVEAVLPYPSVIAVRIRMQDGVAREVPLLAPWYVEARPEEGVVIFRDVEDFPVSPEGRRHR